jgi:5-methylcytosine-specific restriction endonuclease McrBC regulatory subunit McrC
LKRALNQGLFKTYKTVERNDSAVKGAINVSCHIRQNVPFGGRVAYRSREYTFDNHIMQLIRHTIEYIKTKPIGKSILTQDSDIQKAVFQINEVTNETYSFQKRSKVIFENLKPLNHPYYLDYNYLQQLCLMILNNVNSQYSASSSPIYGILFDGAWLWEEYLWTILKDAKFGDKKFEHPTNKDRKGGIRLFDNSLDPEDSSFKKCFRRIYPDFYCENSNENSNDGIILDAKYKRLENGLVRDDLYQIISYMHTMKIPTGGFVYPQKEKEELAEQNPKKYYLANNTGIIKTFGFMVPQKCNNYNSFRELIKAKETFLTSINKY